MCCLSRFSWWPRWSNFWFDELGKLEHSSRGVVAHSTFGGPSNLECLFDAVSLELLLDTLRSYRRPPFHKQNLMEERLSFADNSGRSAAGKTTVFFDWAEP
jgi:hypothetical protein